MNEPRTCRGCNLTKPPADYYCSSNGRLYTLCKKCNIAKSQKYKREHAVERAAYAKAYSKKNRKRIVDNNRRYWLTKRYGITNEQRIHMLSEQLNSCAICGEKEGEKMLHLDHDHRTNEIRRLLCHRCNSVLGYALDSPAILEQAAAYLRSYE